MSLAGKVARPGAAAFPAARRTASPPLRPRRHAPPIRRRRPGLHRDRAVSRARGDWSDRSRRAFQLRRMKRHLDDRCCEWNLLTQRVADLELGLAERRRDPILETASDRAAGYPCDP